MNYIDGVQVNLKGVGKAGDKLVLKSGSVGMKFKGQKLVMGGARANVCQLFVAGEPCMPQLPGGIPSLVFAGHSVGNGLELPVCQVGEEISLEVVLEADGEIEAALLGVKA
jgi:hypothetical protein